MYLCTSTFFVVFLFLFFFLRLKFVRDSEIVCVCIQYVCVELNEQEKCLNNNKYKILYIKTVVALELSVGLEGSNCVCGGSGDELLFHWLVSELSSPGESERFISSKHPSNYLY